MVAKLVLAESQHLFWAIGDLEQRARRLVDASVGRLRGQHDCDKERIRIDMLELAFGLGIRGMKAAKNFTNFGFT